MYMSKLSERIAKSGVNILVVIIAIVVFVVAFIVLITISNASRPSTIEILAANRDLTFGDPIGSSDLISRTVYDDQLANSYIPSDQADQVVGGYAAVPIHAGQPITRDAIISPAGAGTRLSAVLAEYPGYSLFPLPLDANNVVAANSDSYLPGDMVSVTIVIASRPQPAVTPTPTAFANVPLETPEVAVEPTTETGETAVQEALDRGYPPMAKDLFPQGALVVAVQGLPVQTISEQTPAPNSSSSTDLSYVDYNQPKRLVLLVPSESVETLALGLESGDMVIVSMVTQGQPDSTTGFSYWDFEEMFRLERESLLKR
jgi:hypothetical protein